MGPKTAFRLTVMMAFSAGVAYGAVHIGQLPAGPREMVARLGKWLQNQAETPPLEGSEPVALSSELPPADLPSNASSDVPFELPPALSIGRRAGLAEESRPQPFDKWATQASDTAIPQQLDGAVSTAGLVGPGPIGQDRSADRADTPMQQDDSQLEVMASRLRKLGATHYQLEKWGAGGRLFRFTCEVPVGEELGLRQHFEAIAETGVAAISQVLDEVGRRAKRGTQVGP